jgi:hypothetical protein
MPNLTARTCAAIALVAAASLFSNSIFCAAESPAPHRSPLVTTETRLDDAAFVAADGDGKWTFQPAGEASQQSVSAHKVIRWGSFSTPAGGHRLRSISGDELVGYSIEISEAAVSIESDVLDRVEVPRDTVAAVIFDLPADAASARALEKRIAAVDAEGDTLLFANGDQLAGSLVGLTGNKLTLKTADADLVVDRSRAAAIVFRGGAGKPIDKPAGQPAGAGLRIWVGLRDGSRLLAQSLHVQNATATIELVSGNTVSISADGIAALLPIGGNAVYLSDLDHAGYRHIPFLSLAWDYARDQNVTGGPLVSAGRRYLKGLGMHSAARITYNLDSDYRAFQSALAIDDSTGGRGSVTCRVFVDDGSGKWQLKYDSPVIRGGDPPIAFEADLAGVKRISLLVDFADRGGEQDHVNWLDARLVK